MLIPNLFRSELRNACFLWTVGVAGKQKLSKTSIRDLNSPASFTCQYLLSLGHASFRETPFCLVA